MMPMHALAIVLCIVALNQVQSIHGTPTYLYDGFLYNGERNMLLLRLHHMRLLGGGVRHILVESDTTHSGKPKPLYFHDRDMFDPEFAPFVDSIQLVVLNHTNSRASDSWQLEHESRNAVLNGITNESTKIGMLMVSDIDEIPDLKGLKQLMHEPNPCPNACHFVSKMYYYSLAHKVTTENWFHPDVMSIADAISGKWTPQELRELGFGRAQARSTKISDAKLIEGGWHLSYFGSPEETLYKIESFAHQEFNVPGVASLQNLQEARILGLDPLGRKEQKLTSYSRSCDIQEVPEVVQIMPEMFGYMAPHCPFARRSCWKHITSKMRSAGGILTFESARDYIKGGIGGGLTNQMAGIANGLTIARELGIPVMVPSAFSRRSWQKDEQHALQYQRIPFTELFDENKLLQHQGISSDVCLLSSTEVRQLLVKYIPDQIGRRLETIDVLKNVRRDNKRYLKPKVLASLAHLPKDPSKLFEYALGPTSDLLWSTSIDGSAQFSSLVLTSIPFARDIVDAADRIREGLGQFGKGYAALHLRLDEQDGGAFGEVNDLVDKAAIALGKFQTPDLLYLASGKHDSPQLHRLGDLVPIPITRKELLEPFLIRKLERVPEKLAAVDFLICSSSQVFVGFSQSTFSSLARLRHNDRPKTMFYDRPQPPWQIVLSIDPTGVLYKIQQPVSGDTLDYPSY